MKRVLTIHGINTAGKWQEDIEPVLRPFFEPVRVRYRHYRWLGGLKLVLEPWVLIGFVVADGLLWWGEWLRGWLLVVGVPLGLLLGVVLAVVAAPIRRKVALRSVWRQASPCMKDKRPHIIAHSFGTYLTGTALQEYPAARVRRVVLVGCVLHASWNWATLKLRKRDAFDEVRNDWTNKDAVVWLAGWIERRIPGFGQAGRSGFRGDAAVVHNVDYPTALCRACNPVPGALVHNVDCGGLGHSDAFIGPAHAERFWLPFLWGIDPAEYGLLLDFCESAADQQELGNINRLKVVEDELLSWEWQWADRKTLKDYITGLAREVRIPANVITQSARS